MLISGSFPGTGTALFSGILSRAGPGNWGAALKELAQDGLVPVERVSDAHRGGVTWRSTGLK